MRRSGIAGGALTLLAAMLAPAAALASESAGHHDPVATVVLSLAFILLAAKLGGEIAQRLGQPPVLGELVAGVVLGNLGLFGMHAVEFLKTDATIGMLASLGVILLLFEVGLESTVRDMLKVGLSAFLVAALGVVTPFALGWGVGAAVLPEHSTYVHVFLGATLTATSVGITARVLKDLNRSRTDEAKIILGAAVIDDVMGLVVLAVVAGAIAAADRGGSLSIGAVGWIALKACGFLAGALVIGVLFSRRLFTVASRLQTRGVLLAVALSFCFVLAFFADLIGLAPIVGAFAAGLVLEETHYKGFVDRGEHPLEHLLAPITSFLVPVFFVLMGIRVELRTFADPRVLGLAALVTLAAIVGKQASAFGIVGGGIDRVSVGIGMIPRGEVGLIFANIGMSLRVHGEPIVDAATYSAVLIMVIVTTLVTPPALKWSMQRGQRRRERKEKERTA